MSEIKFPTELRVGGIFQQNGDAMRRIDDQDGLLIALVSDQNLTDVSFRDMVSIAMVESFNANTELRTLVQAGRELLLNLQDAEEDRNAGGEEYADVKKFRAALDRAAKAVRK